MITINKKTISKLDFIIFLMIVDKYFMTTFGTSLCK